MPTKSRCACRWAASATTTTWPVSPSSWPRGPATTWLARPWWSTAASRTRAADRSKRRSRRAPGASHAPVLRAAAGDLGGTDAVAQLGAAGERPALLEAEQHRAAPRVAAAGGVDHGIGLDRRDMGLLAGGPDIAALGPERDDQPLHPA